jgi:hypothetical protein
VPHWLDRGSPPSDKGKVLELSPADWPDGHIQLRRLPLP